MAHDTTRGPAADRLIERVKAAYQEHLACWDTNGAWSSNETTPLEDMAEDMADRILADAEALKAAERLAVIALNTECATQADAEQLRAAVNAYCKARGER